VVMMLVATTVALLLLLGFSTSQGAAAAVNGPGAAAAVDGPRPRSFFWFNDVTPALPPFPPHQPPLPPSPPPPHPPLPPLAPPPPSPPPDEFDCHDLGGFDATMFRGMMSQYMERFYGSLPTAPREGREYRRLGTMEIVRYNLSYTNIELGEAKLLGCRNKGANKWWDPVENELDEIGDSVSEMLGPLAPYIGPNKGSRLIEFDTVTLEMEVEPRAAESSREQPRAAERVHPRSPQITRDRRSSRSA